MACQGADRVFRGRVGGHRAAEGLPAFPDQAELFRNTLMAQVGGDDGFRGPRRALSHDFGHAAGDGGQGRDEDHDQGVHSVVGEGRVQRFREVALGGVGAEVYGFEGVQSGTDTGVLDQQLQGRGVADDADPGAFRQRLVGEQLRDVEHLGDVLDPDHAGLFE